MMYFALIIAVMAAMVTGNFYLESKQGFGKNDKKSFTSN